VTIQYKDVTVYVNGEPIDGVESVSFGPGGGKPALYMLGYADGRATGAGLGVARMRSLANDFEAMSGAMAGVPSHWAAQMAKALRRDADAFEEEVSSEGSH